MHIDLNSCFASVEQQANPHLRGRPVVVAAYATRWGCVLASSREARIFGIKTGWRVQDALKVCPQLVVLAPDPWKYRTVHLRLKKLLSRYSPKVVPKSIDEFVIDFKNTPSFKRGLVTVATEIKQQILDEIGDWLTVSIGIASNRFLAKTGAGLHKPDGLDEINIDNYQQIYQSLQLTDLCGIADHNQRRLKRVGINDVWQFYQAPVWKLKRAFQSINGYYWYARLRGFEVDDVDFGRRSFGNSFALPPGRDRIADLPPVIIKLVEKMGSRVRQAGYQAGGVHLALSFRDWTYWGQGLTLGREIFDSREIYHQILKILQLCPVAGPVRVVAVTCFDLSSKNQLQLELFNDTIKQSQVVSAIDQINDMWGSFVVAPATMMAARDLVHDRIAFGNVSELESLRRRTNLPTQY